MCVSIVIPPNYLPECRVGISSILQLQGSISLEPLLLPPCDGLESGNILTGSSKEIEGQPIFPDSVQSWNISGTLLNVTCNNVGMALQILRLCMSISVCAVVLTGYV